MTPIKSPNPEPIKPPDPESKKVPGPGPESLDKSVPAQPSKDLEPVPSQNDKKQAQSLKDSEPKTCSCCNPSFCKIDPSIDGTFQRTLYGDCFIFGSSIIWLIILCVILLILKDSIHEEITKVQTIAIMNQNGTNITKQQNIEKLHKKWKSFSDNLDIEIIVVSIILGYSLLALIFCFIFNGMFKRSKKGIIKYIIWIIIRIPLIFLIPTHCVMLIIITSQIIEIGEYRKDFKDEPESYKFFDKVYSTGITLFIIFLISNLLWLIKWGHDIWSIWMISAYIHYQRKKAASVKPQQDNKKPLPASKKPEAPNPKSQNKEETQGKEKGKDSIAKANDNVDTKKQNNDDIIKKNELN